MVINIFNFLKSMYYNKTEKERMILVFTKEMQILNIVSEHPETEEVFRKYDELAGKCVLCNNLFDSLEEFALEYKIDLHDLILKLNQAINS